MSRLCARRSNPGGLPPFGDGVDGKAAGVVITPVASARCTLSPPFASAGLGQGEGREGREDREEGEGLEEAEAPRGQVRRIAPDEKEVARVPRREEESEDPKFPSAHEASESGVGGTGERRYRGNPKSPGGDNARAEDGPDEQSPSPRTQAIGHWFRDIDARDASRDQARGVDPGRESSPVAAVSSAHQLRKIGDHESEADAEHDGRGQEKNRSAGDRSEGGSSRRDGSSEGHGPPNARTVGEEPARYGGNRHRKERQGQDQRSKSERKGQLV